MKLPSISSRLETLLLPLSLLVSLLLIAATSLTLWITYDEVTRKALRSSSDMLHLAENHISREVDLWLFALDLAVSLTSPTGGALGDDRQSALFSVAERLPSPVNLFLTGPDGQVRADPMDAVPLDGAPYLRSFVQHIRDGSDAPSISEPVPWLAGANKAILMGRRLVDADGGFRGAAVVAVPVALLERVIDDLQGRGPEAVSLALLSADGAMVAGRPLALFNGQSRNKRDAAGDALQQALAAAERGGVMHARGGLPGGPVDQTQVEDATRILTFGWIANTNLLLVASQSTTQIYAKWLERLFILSAVVLLMCVAAILLATKLRTELRRRHQAEIDMAALATTDGLTGLPNRRRFDEVMQRERDRACRARQPLSLLALDADRFKRINDSYGHATGDEVLRLLSKAIAGQLRRPGDFAARTGGEEFAVLLPETDSTGALHVAERIRADFAAATGRFFEGRDGCTLSVGIKILTPARPETVSQLLVCADAALYAAKQGGRDRVVLGPVRPASQCSEVTSQGNEVNSQADKTRHTDGGPDPLWPEGQAGCFA
ncbi:sensor domain-containing diguanylate cyclase [Ancylobacter sp. SL191]|uniref:sensor domain-containing diguanylate cyclase n=1 Tax=Ancylobacter sp. SL191 TaxID=2995166 RepID=UPI00226DAB6E|nr:diguanylate cyclase [Ancylobacter sp. SL191]WAC26506.1 diguanylate cyclase [Ancylobacter sp. SL191]